MFLDIHELELHKIDFRETFAPGKLDLGEGLRQVEPLEVEGSAELLETEIHLRGHLQTRVEIACDRCLEPTQVMAEADFDLFYRPVETLSDGSEVEVAKDELEMGFYEGNGLQLEEVLKEQVILSLPMKNLCRENCAGLCLVCGQNLNQGICNCTPPPKDPRWAALQNPKQ